MGHLSDKYNKKALMLSLLFIASLSCFLLPYASSLLTLTFIAIALALIPSFYPIRSSYLMEKWSSKGRGARIGMYQTAIILFSSPAPAIIGYAIDRSGFNTVFFALSIILLSTPLLLIGIKVIHQENRTKERR
jgi:MFS family permease